MNYTKVSQLIDPYSGLWDEPRLRELFLTVDVNRILQIPLNTQGFDDFIAWNHTKHGRFTVRSAYYLQWKHKFGPRAGQLSMPGSSVNNPVWKSLWKLKIPGKVKIFIWRAMHGIIPVKSILVNRHVGTSGQCPICYQAAEDIMHLLFKCPTAADLWGALGISSAINEAVTIDRSGSAVLEFLFTRKESQMPGFQNLGLKETIAVGAWYLWWIRRQRTHDEPIPPMHHCKMSILTITANAAKIRKNSTHTAQRWSRPGHRQVKVNVDGSFHIDSHTGAIGAILRDHEGRFIAASTTYIEAMAIREGLALAVRLGCNNVQAESDLMETIEACTGAEAWWGESSAVFADCVDLMTLIGEVQFLYCPREANGAAHELARACFNDKISCNWVDEAPSSILSKLIEDVTIS
jgi:ribonuclease HI